jgi:hypothetical protein
MFCVDPIAEGNDIWWYMLQVFETKSPNTQKTDVPSGNQTWQLTIPELNGDFNWNLLSIKYKW